MMPADWSTLPVHSGLQSRPPRESIAVYTMKMPEKNLVYEGYICPTAPENMSMAALQPPPREESIGQKYARLREKIIAEEAKSEARAEMISELQRNRVVESAASSKPGQVGVKAEPRTMPGRGDTADKSKQQIKADAIVTSESKNKPEPLNQYFQRTESNTDYPLPVEILDRRERLLPEPPGGGAEEFICCFEPWENTVDSDCFYVSDFSVQQFT